MLFQIRHFHLFYIVAAAAAAAAAPAMAAPPTSGQTPSLKEGCPDTCGNISIPYPFGTKEDCYHDQDFLITCNTTINGAKAFLRKGDIEVTDISLDEGHIVVLAEIAYDCYYKSGAQGDYADSWIRLKRFKVSDTKNMFVAVGCDTYALISGYQGEKRYGSGCTSICDSIDYVSNGSCSGIGCCQTQLPKRVDYYRIYPNSYQNHTKVWNFNPCSYAFVVQENTFNFSSSYLGDMSKDTMLPVVLDWAIGNETCGDGAKDSNTYACGNHNKCIDNDNGPGYRCSCLDGYQGNPYLPNGCQDIDECKDSKLNECEKVCKNTAGNYTCSCPKGHHGDGRKDGNGCTANQLLVIKIVLVTTGSVAIFLMAFSWVYLVLKKRKLIRLKEKFFRQNGGLMLQQQLSALRERSSETTKIYTSEELEKATDLYAESRIIGRGGNGTVYRGVLADNKIVAIKKSRIIDESQTEQFINEVIVLSQINHRNVVKLLGCCLDTQVPLLVYEFIPNGTLHDHLHNRRSSSLVTREIFLRIATEIAGVMSYLHSSASVPIIHRDIKSTNILLDNDYTAKVADFGASRLVPLDETQLSTMVQGTLGYLDPEYLHTSQLTEKSDVYSFGVVLAEILTRRKVLCFNKLENDRNLATYFVSSLEENRLLQIIDVRMAREVSFDKLTLVANLAERCLKLKGNDRPTMKEVYMELEGLKTMAQHPWINDDIEEIEQLIGVPSQARGPREMTIGDDSIRENMVLPSDGGSEPLCTKAPSKM